MMKRVRCLKTDYYGLTVGEIYEVVKELPSSINRKYDKIVLIDDYNKQGEYFNTFTLFADATMVYRNEVIDTILS